MAARSAATPAGLGDALAELAAHAADIERAGELSPDLLEVLTRAGCFRILVPARYGGDERTLSDALTTIEALASADGSAGWLAAQVAVGQLVLEWFPGETRDAVYDRCPDVIAAGAVAPKGRAAWGGAGWIVSGRWPFVSGCRQASWIYVNCVVLDRHAVSYEPDSIPQMRMMLFPASEVEIVDNWAVAGLRGTASHDVRLSRAHCPHARTYAPAGDDAVDAAAAIVGQAGLLLASVVVGIAIGALEDIIELAAGGKRPAFSRERLADSALFQDTLAEAHMHVRAARALLRAEADTAWTFVRADTPMQPLERAALRASAAQAADLAVRATDAAYALAGGSAVYERSPLQRRLRDAHTATQHFALGRSAYAGLGALLAGGELEVGSPEAVRRAN